MDAVKQLKKTVGRLPVHIIVIGFTLAWLLPTLGLFVTSFRLPGEVVHTGWWTVFQAPFDFTQYTLENYQSVITRQGLGRAFLNSLMISIPATILPVMFAGFAAYAFAWMNFFARDLIFIVMVGLLVVPIQMSFIPIYRLFTQLHLNGTFLGIWIAHTGYGLPLIIYILHNFIAGLPSDLFDAAAIDGASSIQIFFRIVVPLSVPALASVVIFQFLWVWNDLIVALIFLGGSPEVGPLTLKIANLVGSRGQDWELLTAAAFISMILPLIVFFSLQKYFARGLLAGSVKG